MVLTFISVCMSKEIGIYFIVILQSDQVIDFIISKMPCTFGGRNKEPNVDEWIESTTEVRH